MSKLVWYTNAVKPEDYYGGTLDGALSATREEYTKWYAGFVVGDPRRTGPEGYSVERLKEMHLVGLYRDEPKPEAETVTPKRGKDVTPDAE